MKQKTKRIKKPKKCIMSPKTEMILLIIASFIGLAIGWISSSYFGFIKSMLILNTLILLYLLWKINRIEDDLFKITFKK